MFQAQVKILNYIALKDSVNVVIFWKNWEPTPIKYGTETYGLDIFKTYLKLKLSTCKNLIAMLRNYISFTIFKGPLLLDKDGHFLVCFLMLQYLSDTLE